MAGDSSLARLAELGSGFPHLFKARVYAEASLAEKRRELAELEGDADSSVVMFGSWARHELTSGSDEDWALVVDGGPRIDNSPDLTALREHLGGAGRDPGTQGVFGERIFGEELINIGLEDDSNRNLTHRILLVLESVALTNPDVHRRCCNRVLEVYLNHSIKDFRPPRFLLNDLVRYWRTMCVDFVGKERLNPDGEKWALRNAKLRTSRKMLFASGLLPVLLAHRYNRGQMRDFLRDQFNLLPTDRVASTFLDYGAIDAGLRTFNAYDRWLGILAADSSRAELERLSREEAQASPLFRDVTRLAEEIEQGLLTLLFDTDLFLQVRDFGIF